MMNRRFWILAGLVFGTLLLLNGWAWMAFSDARDASIRASENTFKCEDFIQSIHTLQARPSLAQTETIQSAELVRHIEQAVAKVQLPPQALIRVTPDTAQRIGDTPYMEKRTEVQLKDISLSQLVFFLHSLTQESGLRSTAIRISAPRNADSQNKWIADLTLSYWIYSPKSGQPTSTGGL